VSEGLRALAEGAALARVSSSLALRALTCSSINASSMLTQTVNSEALRIVGVQCSPFLLQFQLQFETLNLDFAFPFMLKNTFVRLTMFGRSYVPGTGTVLSRLV
jgi:hypothetical protein